MIDFKTIVRARYSVPQNIPTPANMMIQAIRDAKGQFPIFSVKAIKRERNTCMLLDPLQHNPKF